MAVKYSKDDDVGDGWAISPYVRLRMTPPDKVTVLRRRNLFICLLLPPVVLILWYFTGGRNQDSLFGATPVDSLALVLHKQTVTTSNGDLCYMLVFRVEPDAAEITTQTEANIWSAVNPGQRCVIRYKHGKRGRDIRLLDIKPVSPGEPVVSR